MSATLRGHILVATSRLKDPNFFKAAVLLVEHNDEGTMGLVINRPSSVSVQSALAGHFELDEDTGTVYLGGPVETSALFILHNAQELDPEETPIIRDLFIGSCSDVFESVIRNSLVDDLIRFRIFSGCAGWSAGQLEEELARGDWFVVRATLENVFAENPYAVWEELIEQVHRANRLLPNHPDNPEWN